MRKLTAFFFTSVFALGAAFGIQNVAPKEASAASTGSTMITINHGTMSTYADGYNRLKVTVSNKEGVLMDNIKLRTDSLSLSPVISINGEDYTFQRVVQNGNPSSINSYIACFSQEITGTTSDWPLFFKRDAGQGASGNASFYNSDWPGVPKNKETIIKFYKDSVYGEYKLANDFAFRVSADGSIFDFVYNPNEITISGATLLGTYEWEGKPQVASEDSTVTIVPEAQAGKIITGLTFTNAKTLEPVNISTTSLANGSYSFVMPSYPLNIQVECKDITYSLDCNGTIVEVSPGKVIGDNLPQGRWEIDGFPISSKSIYVWNENKTAVLSTFTLTLYVDNALFDTIRYTSEDKVTLPVIPFKEGYRIEGWSIETLPYHDCSAYAVYVEC